MGFWRRLGGRGLRGGGEVMGVGGTTGGETGGEGEEESDVVSGSVVGEVARGKEFSSKRTWRAIYTRSVERSRQR